MKQWLKVIYAAIMVLLLILICSLYSCSKKESEKYDEIRSEAVETVGKEPELNETEPVDQTQEETEIKPEPEKKYKLDYSPTIKVDHEKMKRTNPDYVCWINIPNTDISYPVVLPTGPYYDNEGKPLKVSDYYLHRTFEKEDAYAGTLFIDAFSNKGLDQDNLIIYGHNMKDGSMFGTLKQFKDKEYFNERQYIEIYTEDELRVYEIFSIRDVDSDIDTLNFALNGFDVREYINSAIAQSINYREVDEPDQIITLSTCVGDYSRRLLISGVRVY